MLKQIGLSILQPQEAVAIYLRQHWFVILKSVALFLISALIPILLLFFFSQNLTVWLTKEISTAILILSLSFYYLYIWLFLFFRWTDYYLDLYTVTNKRIVNREQAGLFSRIISEVSLNRVQDVTAQVTGFFATFLNYGNVYIQTAGEKERFIFTNIPEPYEVAKKIIQLSKEAKGLTKSEL
ncbi:MAG: PH domain-containing protein [Candidatus Buchananbacteria bacterium]